MVGFEVSEMTVVDEEVEVEKRRQRAAVDDDLAIEFDHVAARKLPPFGADDNDEAAAAVPLLRRARDSAATAATAKARGAEGDIAGGEGARVEEERAMENRWGTALNSEVSFSLS